MKVLLLIPPTSLTVSYGKLKKFSNPQPAIGIAYIAAVLRENGHEVKVLDAYVNQSSIHEIMLEITAWDPEVVGLSVLTPSAEVVYEISRELRKQCPRIRIVMGNLHASQFAEILLCENYADVVVHREGETTMSELLNKLQTEGNLKEVQGISFKQDDVIIHTPLRPHIGDLDSLPFPAWDLFPLEKYITDPRTVIKKGQVEMPILATRGCPNQCTFCSSHTARSLGSKYRMRSPKSIVNEITFMYERFGSEVFSFMDLAFPLLREHTVALCQEIILRELQPHIAWVTECRVKPLDQELLILMKNAGCVRICFGIESGNDDMLKSLKKNFTTQDARKAVHMAHKAGIETDGMFMIGLPGETEEMIRETIKFAIELKVRYGIFNLFVPYPGCELYETLIQQNSIRFSRWSDFTSYPAYSGGVPVYVPEGLTPEKLMKLQIEAMRRFYLRPRFILNELRNFKPDKIPHYLEGLQGILLKKR